MSLRAAILILAIPLLLSACASHLSRSQCLSMNWRQVGYNDGASGRAQRDLSKDIRDCARFDIKIDTRKYQKGWRAGTRSFCTPDRGYALGSEGKMLPAICPNDLAPTFQRGWRRGLRRFCVPNTGYELGLAGRPMPRFCAADLAQAFRNAYRQGYRRYRALRDIDTELDRVNGRIARKKDMIRDNQRDIDSIEARLNYQGLPRHERHRLRMRIRQLRAENRRLERAIDNMRAERRDMRREKRDIAVTS